MKFFPHIFQILLLFAATSVSSAYAGDMWEVETAGLVDRRTVNLPTSTEVNSLIGFSGTQRTGFEFVSGSGFWFVMQGDVSVINFGSPVGRNLTNPNPIGFGGSGGFKIGGKIFSVTAMAGMRSNNLLYAPTSTTLSFVNLLAPEVVGQMTWVPLVGKSHTIGLALTGGYQMKGSESTSALTMSQAITYGGQAFLDFTPSGVPISLFAKISQTQFSVSNGDQSRMSFGFGLRFGAALINPKNID